MAERENGCVTNFPGESPKFTIWKSGDYFRAEEFGVGGKLLSIQGDPVFQDLAKEVYRLACEVGRLRRAEIDAKHGIAPAIAEKILEAGAAQAEALIADWLDGQAAAERAKAEKEGRALMATTAPHHETRHARRMGRHNARAGALREAAEAIRQGRAQREGGA